MKGSGWVAAHPVTGLLFRGGNRQREAVTQQGLKLRPSGPSYVLNRARGYLSVHDPLRKQIPTLIFQPHRPAWWVPYLIPQFFPLPLDFRASVQVIPFALNCSLLPLCWFYSNFSPLRPWIMFSRNLVQSWCQVRPGEHSLEVPTTGMLKPIEHATSNSGLPTDPFSSICICTDAHACEML